MQRKDLVLRKLLQGSGQSTNVLRRSSLLHTLEKRLRETRRDLDERCEPRPWSSTILLGSKKV